MTDRVRPSNIWTRAVYYEGLMALYKIKPDTAYLNYAISGVSLINGDYEAV